VRAAVLLSGGLDSATVLAIARADGFECHCLTVDYGQRHRVELQAARRVAAALGAASHRTVTLDLRAIGGSALTDEIEVPKDTEPGAGGVPVTYVPARNTVLLALLLGLAEVVGAADLFIGANALDSSGYPDCRGGFLSAFEELAARATVAGAERGVRFRVRAPLLELTKAETIRRGVELGVDYGLTHSCYDPSADGLACGRCESCTLRRRGFAAAGVPDPTRYA
jgi:7-cyano-7-deazaguanine synthase